MLSAPTTAAENTAAVGEKVRVLVVDDSTMYRKVVRDALATLPQVEVVGWAGNGRAAIEKIEQLSPDMITLDFEMPEVDGLGVLKWLRQSKRPTKAVMLSALTIEGGEATLQALQEGAFDFVVKPSGSNANKISKTSKPRSCTALIPFNCCWRANAPAGANCMPPRRRHRSCRLSIGRRWL